MSDGKDRVAKSAQVRSRRVVEAIGVAIKTIEREVTEANGIYPHNGCRLTMAEVCRRASVHPITMMGKAHRDTTRPMVLGWIAQMGARMTTGSRKVRNTITERADSADQSYAFIASKFQAMYQVEMPKRDAELRTLRSRVAELEAENLRLQTAVTEGRVVRLPRKKT